MHSTGKTDQSIPRYAEPEIRFLRRKLVLEEDGVRQEVEVAQLVRKGEVLADIPGYDDLQKRGFLRGPMEAGENVEYDQEMHALRACCSGYPRVHWLAQQEGPDILVVSMIPCIKIAHNKMQASFVLHPAPPGCPALREEDIDAIVAEAGISHGIDRRALAAIKDKAAMPADDFDDIVFAKGAFPAEGRDALLRFELEIGPLAGHVLADGTIDFRDRRIMVGVARDQHIATKIPAVPGEPGYNVLGQPIAAKGGRDLKVKVIGDALFDAENNRVIATGDGAMSVVNTATIKVSAKLTVAGDVDYTTGNIETEGGAVITGSVQPGFRIAVGGDLEIRGAVSAATICSGGNIVLRGGITGTATSITAGGDVDLHFIERGTVKAGGVVVVRRQCYYSRIEAAGDIRCHPDSSILGGVLLAGGNLSVGNVGADHCEASTLAAGVDPERYLLLQQLHREHIEQQNDIIQALQLLGRGARPKKIRRMEEAADQTKMKLLTLNLIPGTGLFSRIGKGKEREELDDEDPLYLQDVDIDAIRIEVCGRLYAGTHILLGNRALTLAQDAHSRRYRLSKNLKRIMAIPL